jgi:hypothetical protein
MLATGAAAGSGLTVIANAPNPAGVALLKRGFENEPLAPVACRWCTEPKGIGCSSVPATLTPAAEAVRAASQREQ